MAIKLDGKKRAKEIEEELKGRVLSLKPQLGEGSPLLATILVGDDPASHTYVKMKGNACRRVGLDSLFINLPKETTTDELLIKIDELNNNPQVFGILLQHPVPSQIDERKCFNHITIEKDVDGVTAEGFGRMSMGEKVYGSATPQGIMKLLEHYKLPIEGKHAVVIGRSPILGKPMAMMLLNANATVTICHSRTKNLPEIVRNAEIIVGAMGKPEFIKREWIKDGSIVVDAGYHPGGIGDIQLDSGLENLLAYTPVPGGVGPMTIATLITQTVESIEKQLND